MINIIICDDDLVFLEWVVSAVKAAADQLGMRAKIHSFSNPDEISDYVISGCDIALLDIDFHKLKYTGIDVARRIRSSRTGAVIIFVTNYIEFAPEGYEVQAFRYYLKGSSEEKLQQYLQEANAHLQAFRKTIKIQVEGEIIDLPLEAIMYIEGQHHQVKIWLKDSDLKKTAKSFLCYSSLTAMEHKLDQLGFLRIHKSYLVNMRHLKKYQCREALLDDGMILPASQIYYAEQKEKYLRWRSEYAWNI